MPVSSLAQPLTVPSSPDRAPQLLEQRQTRPGLPRILVLSLASVGFAVAGIASAKATAQEPVESVERRRQPVAIALSADGEFLFVANESTGTLSVVATSDPHSPAEFQVGESLSDVEILGESGLLAVVDRATHQLHVLRYQPPRLEVVRTLDVPHTPVQLAFDANQQQLAVASLWSRRLSLLDWDEASSTLTPRRQVDLEVAPRQMQFVEQGRTLIVADNFGGHLLALNAADGSVRRSRSVPAHKIRGLAVTPDGNRLVMSHQMLNSLAHAIRNDVHWGLMMSNDLRWLDLEVLLSEDDDFYHRSHMHPLGQPGAGMADPAGLAMSTQGDVAVAVQGVDRVLVGKESDFSLDAIAVGPGPVDVVFSPDGASLYVAHRWDDSVSIIDVAQRDPVVRIALGNVPDESELELGRRLFHQGRLAHDGWMSCSSCHVDGHTNGQLNDNFSDGSFGAPKRVLTLLGVAGTEPLAWNGAKETLEEQIAASVSATMQAPEPATEREVSAMAAFIRSLPVPPSVESARGALPDDLAESISRGRTRFEALGCSDCHAGELLTSPGTFDVGLVDQQGNHLFNPPSLRGLSQRSPYFHDGSAATLEVLLDESRHQLQEPLSEQERADLLAYLRSL
ncbi:MAG: c-type cytochrome [Planctomycetales bacterium]|nr:c-type cytochrome [Planctomycetales bacterium]